MSSAVCCWHDKIPHQTGVHLRVSRNFALTSLSWVLTFLQHFLHHLSVRCSAVLYMLVSGVHPVRVLLSQPQVQHQAHQPLCIWTRNVTASTTSWLMESSLGSTGNTVQLFSGLSTQRSMQSPCYSYAMLSHIKPGTCGPSLTSKEDACPASNPQQVHSGAASGMSAGRTIDGFISSPSSSPSLANGHWILQAWFSWSISGQKLTKMQHHCPTSPPSPTSSRFISAATFLEKGERIGRLSHSSPSFRLNRHPNTCSACHVQSLLSYLPLCCACSLFRCNTNHANMQ